MVHLSVVTTRHVPVASRWVVSTSSLRSSTLIRSCRSPRCRRRAPARPPGRGSPRCRRRSLRGRRVAPVTFTPYASASRGPCMPGEGRQQRRVGVDHPTAEPSRNAGPTSFMNPALITRSGSYAATRSVSAAVPGAPVASLAYGWTKVGTRRGGPVQPGDPAAIGADGHDLCTVRGIGTRLEQGLQQSPGAGDQHHQARGTGWVRRARAPPYRAGSRGLSGLSRSAVGSSAPAGASRRPGSCVAAPRHLRGQLGPVVDSRIR